MSFRRFQDPIFCQYRKIHCTIFLCATTSKLILLGYDLIFIIVFYAFLFQCFLSFCSVLYLLFCGCWFLFSPSGNIIRQFSVYRGFICVCQKLETIRMSFNKRMNKQAMVQPYSGILLSNKKEQLLIQHEGMSLHYIKWKKPDTTGYVHIVWFHLCNILEKVKLQGRNRPAAAKGWGWKERLLEKSMGKLLWVTEVVYILIS